MALAGNAIAASAGASPKDLILRIGMTWFGQR